jgi:hypothetical protein
VNRRKQVARKPRWQRGLLYREEGRKRTIWVAMAAPTLEVGKYGDDEIIGAEAYRVPITSPDSNRPFMLVDKESVELLDEFAEEVRMITVDEFEAGDDGTIEGKTWKSHN